MSWIVLAAIAAATAGSIFVASKHIAVDTDTSAMLDPELDFQKRARALRDAFPQIKDDLVVIVRAPSLDEADAFAADLRERLIADGKNFSAVFSPAAEPFFRENGLLYLSESALEARVTQMSRAAGLIETLIKSPRADTFFTTLADNDALAERSDLGADTLQDIYAELAEVADASLEGRTRPFAWMGALDTDEPPAAGHVRFVYATPILDYARLQPAKPALSALRAEIAAIGEDYSGRVETFVTGEPALRAEELSSVRDGIGISMGISLIVVGFLLIAAYRSAFMAGLTLVGLVVTLSLTTGFAAVFIGSLNLVSVAFTVLLVGLGLDFAIHLLLHVQERRAANQSMERALRGAVHEVGPAMALAAPTTALAFLSFVPTRFDGIAQLGIIAGVGVVIAFFVSMTLMPAALGAFPNARARVGSGRTRRLFGSIDALSGPVALLTVLAGIAAIAFLPSARFDADPMSLRNAKSPSVVGFNILFDDQDTVPYRLSLIAPDAETAETAADKAKALETVGGVRALPGFVPEDQDAKLEIISFGAGSLAFALDAEPEETAGEPSVDGAIALRDRLHAAYDADSAAGRLAALLDEAIARRDPATLAALEKNIFAFWPQLVEQLRAQMNADYVDIDTLPAALAERYRAVSETGEKWRIDILPKEDPRDRAALEAFVAEVEAAFPEVTGGAVQAKKAGDVISRAMAEATAIAFTVIALFLFFMVRSISTVLLMLFPLGLAATLTIAAGVIFDIPFNYANVIVLPLLIGIGVDSGIHLVMRHEQVEAGENVFGTSTPRAVLFSALTTVASFASLMLSPHRGTASMGELLAIAIAFTLVCTLVVLPAVFAYAERRKANAAFNAG